METDTLLTQYIKSEIQAYQQAESKRRVNEGPTGYSLPKVKSVLLHLVDLKGVDIAEISKVPYGTLRVWRANPMYRMRIAEHVMLFAHRCVDELKGYTERFTNKAYIDTPWGRATGIAHSHAALYALSDITIFSDDVMRAIYSEADRATFSDDETAKEAAQLLRSSFLENVLPYVWSIRKGDMIVREDKLVAADSSLRVSHPSEPVSVLTLARIFERPWDAPRQVVREAVSLFLKRMEGVL